VGLFHLVVQFLLLLLEVLLKVIQMLWLLVGLKLLRLRGVSRVFFQLVSETFQVRIVRLVLANRGASFMVMGRIVINLNANFMWWQHKRFKPRVAHARVACVRLGGRS